MTTFERCFVSDKRTWAEKKNPYYSHVERYDSVCRILHEFGLLECESHVINGHVPVRTRKGERPIKANGRYILIDGGFCKSYHDTTGIAGYTLIYSSRGLRLVAHSPFDGKGAAVMENKDILAAEDIVFEMMDKRKFVIDTDEGDVFRERISDLRELLEAYREGIIPQL
jgi:fructose-1,6-bisphosphatase-3